jgi:hypothetical protein
MAGGNSIPVCVAPDTARHVRAAPGCWRCAFPVRYASSAKISTSAKPSQREAAGAAVKAAAVSERQNASRVACYAESAQRPQQQWPGCVRFRRAQTDRFVRQTPLLHATVEEPRLFRGLQTRTRPQPRRPERHEMQNAISGIETPKNRMNPCGGAEQNMWCVWCACEPMCALRS